MYCEHAGADKLFVQRYCRCNTVKTASWAVDPQADRGGAWKLARQELHTLTWSID